MKTGIEIQDIIDSANRALRSMEAIYATPVRPPDIYSFDESYEMKLKEWEAKIPTTVQMPKDIDVTDFGPQELDLRTTYMRGVHDPEHLMALAQKHIKGVDYDTLVGTGLSGTIAVTELARRLGKKYLIVRKPGDGTHSSLPVEGKLGKRWIFVDDLISTGTTATRVSETIEKVTARRGFKTRCVGVFLYADYNDLTFFDADSFMTQKYFNQADNLTDTKREETA